MREQIRLCILPIYKTNVKNTNNKFSQYSDVSGTLDLVRLDNKLNRFQKYFDIRDINITGGEPSLLSELYFDMLYNVLKLYTRNISIDTNFFYLNKSLINSFDIINILFDYNESKSINQVVLKNIKAASNTSKITNLKMYDNIQVSDIPDIIDTIKKLNIKTYELLPIANDPEKYDELFKALTKELKKNSIAFKNELRAEGIIHDDYPTVYVTPDCCFALGKLRGTEFFLEEYFDFEDFIKKFKTLEKYSDVYV